MTDLDPRPLPVPLPVPLPGHPHPIGSHAYQFPPNWIGHPDKSKKSLLEEKSTLSTPEINEAAAASPGQPQCRRPITADHQSTDKRRWSGNYLKSTGLDPKLQ